MNRTKLLTLVVVLILTSMVLAACAPPEAPVTKDEKADSGGVSEQKVKVALLLTATIDDAGWAQTSYEGFKRAEEDLGFEGAYTESVTLPDQEATMRNYATSGYDVIVMSSADFSETALTVSADYPEIKFVIINGSAAQEPNLANFRPNTAECGFIAGSFAGLVSTNNSVGIINGQKFPPVEDAYKGFAAGAEYVNPGIEVKVAYTDSWTDVEKAREASLAMIEDGTDVLASNCSNGVLGVIDAAVENDILVTGYINDQYEMAPGTIPFSALQDVGAVVYSGIESAISGSFKAETVVVGVKEGVISLSAFHEIGETAVSDVVIARMKEIYEGLKNGSLKEEGVVPKSTFEQ